MKRWNVVIKAGTYVDKATGVIKPNWLQIGTMIQQDESKEPFLLLDSTILSTQLNFISNEYHEKNLLFSCYPAKYIPLATESVATQKLNRNSQFEDDDIPF